MAEIRLECPRCHAKIVGDDAKELPPDFPFCSERCRLIDLGKWFDEDFKIVRDIEQSDLEQLD